MVRTAAVAAVAWALAACGPASTTPGTTPEHHDDPNAPRREPYLLAEASVISLTASDAQFFYWVDPNGLHRRPHGAVDVKSELVNAKLPPEYLDGGGVMLVAKDRGFILRGPTVTSVSLVEKDAAPELVVTMPGEIDAYTASPDGRVFIAAASEVLEVGAGKQPKVIAEHQGAIQDVIADDENVYIATNTADPNAPAPAPPPYYGAPMPEVPKTGSLRKVPRDGGKVVELAGAQPLASALAVFDRRLWWSSSEGPAVSSVAIDGGDVRVEVRGRAGRLAVDEGGLTYRQENFPGYGYGSIVERRNGALQLGFAPDGTFNNADKIVLSPEWTYIDVQRYATGTRAILALPRQTQPVQIAFDLDRSFSRLRVDDDVVYWTEISRTIDGHVHLMRGDPSDGSRRELADHEGTIAELAVGGGQVYFDDNYTISQVATTGGDVRSFDRTDSSWVIGLAVHRNHVYWFDGSALYARKRRGGAPFVVARNDNSNYYGYGYGYYGGEYGGDMVFDDDFVYTTGFGQGGVGIYQISERGQVKMLWSTSGSYPGKDLVMLGDELFFATGQGGPVTVTKVTADGVGEPLYHARSQGYGTDLVQGGGMLYLLLMVNDYWEVTRIDPSTGEGVAVFRIYNAGGEYPTLGTDARGVYLGMEPFDAIFRISHDAPAIKDTGWPSDGT